MTKYLKEYIKTIESKLKGKVNNSDKEELLDKINFFSHERLVHLLITLFFALISIIFTVVNLYYFSILLIVVTLICYVLLVFYILHYFFLENSVQYLYKLYDKMNEKIK